MVRYAQNNRKWRSRSTSAGVNAWKGSRYHRQIYGISVSLTLNALSEVKRLFFFVTHPPETACTLYVCIFFLTTVEKDTAWKPNSLNLFSNMNQRKHSYSSSMLTTSMVEFFNSLHIKWIEHVHLKELIWCTNDLFQESWGWCSLTTHIWCFMSVAWLVVMVPVRLDKLLWRYWIE